MFDPNNLTLGQVSSAARDFTLIGFLFVSGWKLGGVWKDVKTFFERLTKHMNAMEEGMNTLLTNHLTHIEADLRHMTHRQVRASSTELAQYVDEDTVRDHNQTEL